MRASYRAGWVLAVIATGVAFVCYLALRFETFRLGYGLDEATREHKRLTERRSLVALEAQTLRERQRVTAIAERSLRMTTPDVARVIVVDDNKPALGAGRAR